MCCTCHSCLTFEHGPAPKIGVYIISILGLTYILYLKNSIKAIFINNYIGLYRFWKSFCWIGNIECSIVLFVACHFGAAL